MRRFFTGLSEAQIATMRGVSTRTVQREWRFARAWLHRELAGGGLEEDERSGDPHLRSLTREIVTLTSNEAAPPGGASPSAREARGGDPAAGSNHTGGANEGETLDAGGE